MCTDIPMLHLDKVSALLTFLDIAIFSILYRFWPLGRKRALSFFDV